MLFNDFGFVAFLAVSLTSLRLTPAHRRWVTLLALSCTYYLIIGSVALVGLLVGVAGIAWGVAIAVDHAEDETVRWRRLRLGVGTALLVLISVRVVLAAPAWIPAQLRLGSAIGVSYWTLQAISYVVDVYMGRMAAERSFGKVLTYLALFPKIVQGPIERAPQLLPQFKDPKLPGYEVLRRTVALFGWGLFKKVVLADRLALFVDPIYAQPGRHPGVVAVFGVYAFAFQLYFDFSGYTDMARATARFLGIELTENFRAPYLATSISDFWRRWHISFSRWLLDYIFTPLQIAWRRQRVAGTALALFVTFTISGLWHGSTWTFLVWGTIHGGLLAAETLWKGRFARKPAAGAWSRLLRVALTFHAVTLSWVFFRAPSLRVAGEVLRATLQPAGLEELIAQLGTRYAAITLGALAVYAVVAFARERPLFHWAAQVTPVRWAGYFALTISILLLRHDASSYLYSQF